jgi:spore germination protein GerM
LRRLTWRIIALGVVLVVVALVWRARTSRPPVVEPPPADSTAAGVHAATLWFPNPAADGLVAESREMPVSALLHDRVAGLVEALEQGPREGGSRSLPEGTLLLHAYLDEGGVLTLDLSRTFRQGFHGGARAEELAIGSLVRTLAANVPEAKRVRITCAGAVLPTLGGHFPLDRPLDPAEWP